MKKHILILIFFTSTFSYCIAQTWVHYSQSKNGLTSNGVNSIYIDSNNNKVFATDGGISIYDGKNWNSYTAKNSGLTNQSSYSAIYDKQRNLWSCALGGVFKYDGTNWTKYTNPAFNGGNWFWQIIKDSSGNLYMRVNQWGIIKYDGQNWTKFMDTTNDWSTDVDLIDIDPQNNIWVSTWGGVYKFDGTNWITCRSGSTSSGDQIESMAFDDQGNAWFATTSNGILKYDGHKATKYTTQNSGLPTDETRAIAIDKEGNKWIGGRGGSVSKFDGTNWTSYKISGYYVDNMAIDKNNIVWVGFTADGVYSFDATQTSLNIAEESNIQLYPNPSNHSIYITNAKTNCQVSIYDINGQLVLKEFLKQNEIDITDLVSGIYIVKMEDSSGLSVKKLVKE